jgi:hypothetical protein
MSNTARSVEGEPHNDAARRDRQKIPPADDVTPEGGAADTRRSFNQAVFGKQPTASCLDSVNRCAEYWAMKHMLKMAPLGPHAGRNLVPIGFAGVARLKKIFNDFNSLRDTWDTNQLKVMHMFCNPLLPDILAEDRERCIDSVMLENHWTKIHDEVLLLAARGLGKTWLLISALATFFVNIPAFSACVYAGTSTKGHDFYTGIADQVRVLVNRLEPGKRPKLTITRDIMLAKFPDGDVRWIRPFSTFGMVRATYHYYHVVY